MLDGVKQVLSGVSAADTAGVFDEVLAHAYHTLTVIAGTGVTAGKVEIQLSQDNENWFAPASNSISPTAAGCLSVTVGPVPARFAKAIVDTKITGGTADAWIACA